MRYVVLRHVIRARLYPTGLLVLALAVAGSATVASGQERMLLLPGVGEIVTPETPDPEEIGGPISIDQPPPSELRFAGVGPECNRPPAHCVWVAPRWQHSYTESGDGTSFQEFTDVAAVNPGMEEARIDCAFLDRYGNAANVQHLYAGPGERIGWTPFSQSETYGWILIVATEPVLPEGHVEYRVRGSTGYSSKSQNIVFYPVDCTDPSGFEFVCQMAQAGL